MHPYTYAALAGIVGGISVLLAKCVYVTHPSRTCDTLSSRAVHHTR